MQLQRLNETENETAAFNMARSGQVADGDERSYNVEDVEQTNLMNQTFQELEMRATKISMKLGMASIEGSMSGEETDELERFQRLSLPQKRKYIKRMESLRSGFMTPGMQMDNLIDIRIQELDRKFKDINFGQSINHETFEYFKPRKLDPEENAGEYRKWKLR